MDSIRPNRVSVVIPALNEEKNLPHVASVMPSDIDEVVLVGGSTRMPAVVDLVKRMFNKYILEDAGGPLPRF